ncbi:hypothetical protein [Haemophilus parahaemolyticus]|uniref:hypothetical protein n=1 Tax=Haemophilus parahaemolyticus TaxID=735 RepID=UPI0028E4216E|nr:hypothetical protein [Haemophilus parahaemolyticus]
MRFSTYINNAKCLEWKLNANQGALLDYLISSSNFGLMAINYQSICDQLPLFYKKPDTVYRALKTLIEKGLIINHRVSVQNKIEIISVSKKCMEWKDEQ